MLLAAGAVEAQAAEPAAWTLQGESGTVLLLGSLHLMPPQLRQLPESVERLYRQADTLVLELNPDELDPQSLQQDMIRLGATGPDRTLSDYMDAASWQQARALAADMGLDLQLLAGVKPWLAALTVTQFRLMQLGFAPEYGVDLQLATRAAADGKPTAGLETAAGQLAVFDGLPEDEQVELLLQSLQDAIALEQDMDAIVAAWRRGDTALLEDELLGSMRQTPALYQRVLVDRNRDWLEPIEALLQQPGTHLVVVGAMHLVGNDSVVAMLARRGHQAERH